MISIIPKPNFILDKESVVRIDELKIIIPEKFSCALEEFKKDYKSFINDDSEYYLEVVELNFANLEEYAIDINHERIMITAKTEVAVYYAIQSLRQIINVDNGYMNIVGVYISDKPKYHHRSFSLDECRHFFGKEEVKKIIDVLSLLKFNYFHWHLSDDQGFRINLKKFPMLKEVGSKRKGTKINNVDGPDYECKVYEHCYEEEDIKEIIDYAEKKYISIIPEIDMPGHTGSIVASYPHLHCEGKQIEVFDGICGFKDIICLGKESTYDFVKNLLNEVLRIFSKSEFFHLGGDEVIPSNWCECKDCKKKVEENNLKDVSLLQEYFTNRILNECLIPSGKKIIMWHDGIKDNTNKDVILQYWTWQMDRDGIDKINNGRKTIYSPCSQLYFDAPYAELPLKTTYDRGIKLDGLTKKGLGSVFGIECCMWTEFIREPRLLEFMLLPRLHAVSESSWTYKKNRNYKSFFERLKFHYEYLEKNGYVSASPYIIDRYDDCEKVSKEFRNKDRYVEMKLDEK